MTTATKPKRIPIKAAREVGKAYGYDQVIIIARHFDEAGHEDQGWSTTWGRDRRNCQTAAGIGNFITEHLFPSGDAETAKRRCKVFREALPTIEQAQDGKDYLEESYAVWLTPTRSGVSVMLEALLLVMNTESLTVEFRQATERGEILVDRKPLRPCTSARGDVFPVKRIVQAPVQLGMDKPQRFLLYARRPTVRKGQGRIVLDGEFTARELGT